MAADLPRRRERADRDLFVLKTGIAWEDLPQEAFQCVQNVSRRLAEWPASASGSGCTSCSWQSCGRGTVGLVTSAGRFEFGESPARRPKTGPNPTDRGRSGSKHCLLTDAGGIPLVVQLQPANQHDVNTCLPLVIEMPAVRGKPGRPKQKPTCGRRQSVRLQIAAATTALARHRTPDSASGTKRSRTGNNALVHRTYAELVAPVPTTPHPLGPKPAHPSGLPDPRRSGHLLSYLDQ